MDDARKEAAQVIAAAGNRKKTSMDEEFAKMLGLDDDFAHAAGVTTFDDDADDLGSPEALRETQDFGYEPTIRGRKSDSDRTAGSRRNDKLPLEAVDSAVSTAVGGLDASFFSDDGPKQAPSSSMFDESSSLSSFMPTTDRRSREGGSRRNNSIEDPFAAPATRGGDLFGSTKTSSGHDEADKGSTSSGQSKFDSLFGAPRRFDDLFGGKKDHEDGATRRATESNLKDEGPNSETPAVVAIKRSASATTQSSNAKDDLLAELFPSEQSSSRNSRRAKEKTPPKDDQAENSKRRNGLLADLFPTKPTPEPTKPVVLATKSIDPELDDKQLQNDLLSDLFPSKSKTDSKPSSSKAVLDPEKEAAKLQDDLLSDLFPTTTTKPSARQKPLREEEDATETSRMDRDDSERSSPQEKSRNTPPKTSPPSSTSKSSVDLSSARDSLLMDLIPESPPKTSPVGRRRSEKPDSPVRSSNTDIGQKEPSKRLSMTPSPGSSPSRVSNTPQYTPDVSPTNPPATSPLLEKLCSEPPASPGRTKTIVISFPASIKEIDFEQSKDSLLEELLAPPSPKSPIDSRRNSASQSCTTSEFGEQQSSPDRRRRSMSISPTKSPDRAAKTSPHKETASPQVAEPTAKQEQITAIALELRKQKLLDQAEMTAKHQAELIELKDRISDLEKRLQEESARVMELTSSSNVLESSRQRLQQEQELYLQQITTLRSEKQQLQQDLHALQMQHALCETQFAFLTNEKSALHSQIKVLEEQNRQLLQTIAQEKQDHQTTQLRFAQFQQEYQQQEQLHRQKEAQQMDKLYQQLQSSLVSLKMVHEQVFDEETTKREVENESRLRMITTLETSSRTQARCAEEECFRLTSLLTNLETTLRHYRQEHLEEKERLRQEQMRLNMLATHFQAQTNVMHEKADANTQMLAQYFTASLQDVRVAESRLATRRQALEDEEKQLYNERTQFAAYREECIAQNDRLLRQLQRERMELDDAWRDLHHERDDLEAMIASHEDEFQSLREWERQLEEEKQQIAIRANQVSEVARKVALCTQQMVAREDAMRKQQHAMETANGEWSEKEKMISSEKQKLNERELRLHNQLKQMEKARRRLNDERKQQILLKTTTRKNKSANSGSLNDNNRSEAETSPLYSKFTKQFITDNNRSYRIRDSAHNGSLKTEVSIGNIPAWKPSTTTPSIQLPSQVNVTRTPAKVLKDPTPPRDPSGLSPALRELVESHWKQQSVDLDQAEAALHKERMAINCIGLDTRNPLERTGERHSISAAEPSCGASALNSTPRSSISSHRSALPPPPHSLRKPSSVKPNVSIQL